MTNEEWEQRLVQAASFQAQDVDCSMCAGTGGWPGLGGGSGMAPWVPCKVCGETGRRSVSAAVPGDSMP